MPDLRNQYNLRGLQSRQNLNQHLGADIHIFHGDIFKSAMEIFSRAGFLRKKNIRNYAQKLIERYDIRSGQGPVTLSRSMSGGNQQKAIIAREMDKNPELLIAVQPTRGLDVGAIESIHRQLVAQRDAGKAVLLVSLELDEVMNISDRILVMYEGRIVGRFDPKNVTVEELGLYMAGAKKEEQA